MAGPSLLMMGLDKSTMPRGSREPEWGSLGQYQKDSGAGRKRAISGHLGGWPMEGVFFSYGVCHFDSGGVLRKGFSAF